MDIKRWSSLSRSYDLSLPRNRFILVLTAAGAIMGFIIGYRSFWAGVLQAAVAAAIVFLAAALAKEVDPDKPSASLLAAGLGLPFIGPADPLSPVALFWLLGSLRLLNRSTGVQPRTSDVLGLIVLSGWLSWQVTPLFGILMGGCLILDGLLPSGLQANRLTGGAILLASAIGWSSSHQSHEILQPWQIGFIMAIAIAFIGLVILKNDQTSAVDDATGKPLHALRVQAGQAFALSAGLSSASLLGKVGITLYAGLWAALLGILIYHLVFSRFRHLAALL